MIGELVVEDGCRYQPFAKWLALFDPLEGRKQVPRNVDLQECLAAGTFAIVEWSIGKPNARPISIGQVAASYVAETALKYFRRSVFCRPMKDRQH